MIRAEQLIYTNIAQKYSPSGRRGYQTVCTSAGISESDCLAIENQGQGLPEGEADGVRWQYYRLADQRAVLTCSRRFPVDPEYSDPRGAFLMHALVIAPEAFASIGCNPIAVLDSFEFVKSVREIVDRFGTVSREIPCAEVQPSFSTPSCGEWPGPALLHLAALAAKDWRQDKKSLLILGSSGAVQNVLKLAFHFALPSWREHCAFDTMTTTSMYRPGSIWALGTHLKYSVPEGYIAIDPSKPGNLPSGQSIPRSLYGRWLQAWLGENLSATPPNLDIIPPMQASLQALESGRPLSEDVELSQGLCQCLESIADEEIRSTIISRLKESLSPELGTPLGKWVLDSLSTVERITLTLRPSSAHQEIPDWAFHWMLDRKPELSKAACKRLFELADKAGHDGLALLAAVWQRGLGSDFQQEALRRSKSPTYEALFPLCPAYIPAIRLASARHGRIFLSHLVQADIDDRDFADCMIALIADGYNDTLSVAFPKFEKLSKGLLSKITTSINETWQGDEKFKIEALHKFPTPKAGGSLWGRIFGKR